MCKRALLISGGAALSATLMALSWNKLVTLLSPAELRVICTGVFLMLMLTGHILFASVRIRQQRAQISEAQQPGPPEVLCAAPSSAESELVQPTDYEPAREAPERKPQADINRALTALQEDSSLLALSESRFSAPNPADTQGLRRLLDSVAEGIFGYDANGLCTFCNSACVAMLGYGDEDDLIGKRLSDLMPNPVVHVSQDDLAEQPIYLREKMFWRADGSLFPVEYWSFPTIEFGDVVGAVVRFVDISTRKGTGQTLHVDEHQAQVALRAIADGVITTDARDRVRYLNPAAETILGWDQISARGKPLSQVMSLAADCEDNATASASTVDNDHHRSAHTGPRPVQVTTRCGKQIYIERSAADICNRDGTAVGQIIVFRDVSDSRRITLQLAYQATHDMLTNTVNRREFERRIERLLSNENKGAALLFLDLDQFKVVNDTCGHSAGDELLRQIAELLKNHLRRRDTLARLGGDEFGILLEHCTLSDACRVADSIRDAVHNFRFAWDNNMFSLGVSIGLVDVPTIQTSLSELLATADRACYAAKQQGRNRVQVQHLERPDRCGGHERHWLPLLNTALEEDHFRLFYQDIVPTCPTWQNALGEHVEILVRMVDDDGKLALPGAFLPAAERYDVIRATDRWVVHHVFKWMAMPERDTTPRIVSINLSGPTVSDSSFPDFVLETASEIRVASQRICFEITETSAISRLSIARTLIQRLSQCGFRFALDDFGSGLGSFSHLHDLAIDYFKVDGIFIRSMVKDPINRAMVRSINDIGHIMGKKTIAESVEDLETLRILDDIGVDLAQGYSISRPKPLEHLGGNIRLVAQSA